MFDKVILLVLDGVGAGALPDAPLYGDEGSNTLVHSLRANPGFRLPFLEKSGLGNIIDAELLNPISSPLAYWGLMRELSVGKDTIIGHWEMMGVYTSKPFPTYPEGFPQDVISRFEEGIGRKTIGNIKASGTEILKTLGPQHVATGYPIVYTSADSVFQIACHEEVVPLQELYRYCQIARSILVGKHGVLRVIARPFIGKPESFIRTTNRKDFPLPPPYPTALDLLLAKGIEVFALGKIEDVFSGRGISFSRHTGNNGETMHAINGWLSRAEKGFCFANLGDFDTLWGHRRLPDKFVGGLEEVDLFLKQIFDCLSSHDLLIVTADHGNDPTFTRHTDHTREMVPILIYRKGIAGKPLGTRESFADVGATILAAFDVQHALPGKSLLTF